jgi:hypothetical protein
MHLPDHIANLNSYSPPSPPPNPFPNLFRHAGTSHNQGDNQQQSGSGYHQQQNDVDLSLDAQLARQLELWTNTDFTFDDDIGPFPGLEEFDVEGQKEKQDAQNEDEMDMRELFEGKVRGMKGNKNVLMDRRREMEMEQQEKAAYRNQDEFHRDPEQQQSGDVHVLSSANRAAAAAVHGMPTPSNLVVPPPTPSMQNLQQFSQHQQPVQAHQSQPQNQVNDLASFLSQFYNSNTLPANALSKAQPQPLNPPNQQLGSLPQFQPQQQSNAPVTQSAASQNPSVGESLVHLLQGLTGQYNAQMQQQCPAPPVVLPLPTPTSQKMSNVTQWIERQGDGRPPFIPSNDNAPQHVERPYPGNKRPLTVDKEEMQYSSAKRARQDTPPRLLDELKSIELHDMVELNRGPPSTAASVSGDSRRKSQAHGTPSRADLDLEPKSIPMGKGLVMVDGEVITLEEE